MTDPLDNLLHQADAAASGDAPLAPDLGPRIRRRVGQRRHRRVIVAGVGISCTAILAVVILSRVLRPGQPELANNPPAPPPPPGPSTQVAPVPEASLAIDPVADARDDAALTMVVIARRRARTLGPDDAAAAYRRTIELFPETHWAAIARTELAGLPH